MSTAEALGTILNLPVKAQRSMMKNRVPVEDTSKCAKNKICLCTAFMMTKEEQPDIIIIILITVNKHKMRDTLQNILEEILSNGGVHFVLKRLDSSNHDCLRLNK
jgi:hypothetical protein